MDNVKISGIIFKHNENDLELWTDFCFSEEDIEKLWEIFMKYNVEGCSIRGTKKEIMEELGNE